MVELQLMAGSISSIVFVSSSLPMVVKAVRTRDMRSYSPANIILANVGNLLYWIYVLGLPVGPVWFLHGFNTLVSLVMLLLYLHHETGLHRIGEFVQKRQSVSRR
jgi:uncharacterized protein with PQ loop repeat